MNLIQSGSLLDPTSWGVPPTVVVATSGLIALVAGILLRIAVAKAERPTRADARSVSSGIQFRRRWASPDRPTLDAAKSLATEHIAVLVIVAWIALSFVILVSLGQFTFEGFLLISVIGYLVSGFLMSPPQTSEKWWARYRLLRIPVLLMFAYLVYLRVMTVIQ